MRDRAVETEQTLHTPFVYLLCRYYYLLCSTVLLTFGQLASLRCVLVLCAQDLVALLPLAYT